MTAWPWKSALPAAVPPDSRVYAIGDIHGQAALLDELLAMIERDGMGRPETNVLVFVGDYVDRGGDSKGVVEQLLNLRADFVAHFLRGNHDQALLDFLADPGSFPLWRDYGADETLASYGVPSPQSDDQEALRQTRDRLQASLPASHRRFFETLKLSETIGDYFFAHAGVRPGTALDQQEERDLMWIRDDFLNSRAAFGKIVVHGHTPTNAPVVRRNRIGIDTGAYMTGRLTALVLEGTRRRFLQT
jgi:serine/threonine protein phosphatase 1